MSILVNVAWLSGDKVVRLLGTLLLGMIMARQLGPGDFGVFSYVTAYIAIFASFANLGLQTIVVRELVSNGRVDQSFATAFILQFIAGVIAAATSVLFIVVFFGGGGNEELLWGVCVLSASMPFKASDVVRYWYEAAVHAKRVVVVEFWVWLGFLLAKIALVIFGFGLKALFVATLVEVLATYIAFHLLFRSEIADKIDLKPDREKALLMLREAWPLMVSGASIMLYMRLDQVMIGHFLDQSAVGIYSAATRIGEAWYFLPIALVSSAFPSLVRSRLLDPDRYQSNLRLIATAISLLSYCVALAATMSADSLISFLYGNAYSDSAAVLSVYIWGGIFVSMSTLGGRWLVAEGLTYMAAIRSLMGAVANFLLNLLLIPAWGVLGAAFATVFSFAIANVLSFGLSAKSRPLFWILLRSLALMDVPLLARAGMKRLSRT